MASAHRPRDEALVEIGERLRAMQEREAAHYAVPDYLGEARQRCLRDNGSGPSSPTSTLDDPSVPPGASSSSGSQIEEAWREKICEWCYEVVDHFDFDREVVSLAMSYLDRYLAARAVNQRIFQLAAVTALHLAIKLFERGRLCLSSLVDLSRGQFLAEHVVAMEGSMLRVLGWRVHPPTPLAFCRDYGALLLRDWSPERRRSADELSRFLVELSVCDYWFATRRPSSVALASVVYAVELCAGPNRWHEVDLLRRVGVGFDVARDVEIAECYERLRGMYLAGDYRAGGTPSSREEEDAAERASQPRARPLEACRS